MTALQLGPPVALARERAAPPCALLPGRPYHRGPTVDFEVTMPLRWSRQHTVTVALAIAVVLIWALAIYKVFLD